MDNFKLHLIPKVILLSVVLFVMPSNKSKTDTLSIKQDTIINPNSVYYQNKNIITQPDSIDVNKIIEEAKKTVEAYNKVQLEKAKVSKESLVLSKIEVENTKISNKLMEKIIKKYQENNNQTITYGQIKADSTCIKSVKYLFKKSKVCTEWQIDYYVINGNNKIIIETLKEKR